MSQSLLPPGTNVITLTATNSKSLSASTNVTIYVDDYIDPVGPTMDVSPGWVTWHINSDVIATQSQTLNVSNFGRGSLTWQVTSDASWLTTNKSTGADGELLTAFGDPAGMNNGDVRAGHLTFTTNSNGPTQTIQMLVQLIKGDLYQSPYLGPMPAQVLFGFYLPVVEK